MQYRTNALRRKLLDGQVAIGTGSHEARDAATMYTIAAAGADYVFIDLEHSSLSIETTAALIAHAHGAGITPLVRVPRGDRGWVTRVLDAGCQTILAPQIRTADEVHELLELCRYAPAGRRGSACHGSASTNYADVADVAEHTAWQNANVLVGINVETPEAVDSLEQLLLPGLDFVNIGHQDLSLLYGAHTEAGQRSMRDAVARVRAVCAERQIFMGDNPATVDGVRQSVANGARMITYAGLLTFLRRGLDEAVACLRDVEVGTP